MSKLNHRDLYVPITDKFLRNKIININGQPQKWILFCYTLLPHVDSIELYEAKTTVSKYLLITKGSKSYKVRFSNHKPNYGKEKKKDCDFFVGVNNLKVTRTQDALDAVVKYFKLSNLTLTEHLNL